MPERYFVHAIRMSAGAVSRYILLAIQWRTQRARRIATFDTIDALVDALRRTQYVPDEVLQQLRDAVASNAGSYSIQDVHLGEKELEILRLAPWD